MEDKKLVLFFKQIKLKNETFPSEDEVWERIQERIQSRHRKKGFTMQLTSRWVQIAASLVLVTCTALWFGSKVRVTTDEDQHILLLDGSQVDLLAGSSLSYNRIGWIFRRDLRLEGSATFEVNKGRRFRVKTDWGRITVLGTRFFVSQDEQQMHVACYEGSVRVETKTGEETLHPGQQVDCGASGMHLSTIEEPLPEYLQYTDAPLTDIIEQISEIYGLQVHGIDACANYTFSGMISTQNREQALDVLFGSCGFKYSIEGNSLTLKR